MASETGCSGNARTAVGRTWWRARHSRRRTLDLAIQRPIDKCNYGEPDIADAAAAYAFGIARNHPFVDGNKRTALVASRAFLLYNGYQITAPKEDRLNTFLALASGNLSEVELAVWFRNYLLKI